MSAAAHIATIVLILSSVIHSVVGKLDSSTIDFAREYFAHRRVRVVRSFACKMHGTYQPTLD